MNKKILCFILFFIILIITILGCVSNANNKNKTDNKEESEIGYLDSKLVALFNSLNNIQFENYSITVVEANEQDTTTSGSKLESKSNKNEQSSKSQDNTSQESASQSESSNNNTGSNDSGSSNNNTGNNNSESGNNGNSDSNKESSNSQNSSSEEESKDSSSQNTQDSSNSKESSNKQYRLERIGVLTNDKKVDWDVIKNEIELMYSVIPTITLDLYKKGIHENDIISFNKEMDKLMESIKEENKEKTLTSLAEIYSYLPRYSRNISSETKTLLLETKSNIFYAYSLLEKEDWNQMRTYLQTAIDIYTRILNNIDSSQNENSINKCYVLLNELNSSLEMKDKDIFLLKYKNLLEELNMV